MFKKGLSDEEVEREIERLRKSPMVALARKNERLKNQRRQTMYTLRCLEKKGLALAAEGITSELLDEIACASDLLNIQGVNYCD